MASERVVISGFVKNGMIVPRGHTALPEGTQVEIVIPAAELPPELRAEFEAWERVGDEAWAQIDQYANHPGSHECGRSREPSWLSRAHDCTPGEPGDQ